MMLKYWPEALAFVCGAVIVSVAVIVAILKNLPKL